MEKPRWLPREESMPSTPKEWADLVGRLKNVSTVMAQQANDAGCNYENARDMLTELIGSGQVDTGSLWGNVVLAATQQRNPEIEQQLDTFATWLSGHAGLIVLMEGEAGGLYIARLTSDPCRLSCERGGVNVELPTGKQTLIDHHSERFGASRLRPDFDRISRFARGQKGLWVVGERKGLLIPFHEIVEPLSDVWRILVEKFEEKENEPAAQPA